MSGRIDRRAAFGLLAAACCGVRAGHTQQEPPAPPQIGRYRVYINGTWHRNLVIESATEYAYYEQLSGNLSGRGTYNYDGNYARFPTGPLSTLGWWGRSYMRPDGKHGIRLSRYVLAVSEN